MATGTITNDLRMDGITYRLSTSVVADSTIRIDKTGDNELPVAKVGQLTTRTDNDTGTLTMVTGHGITTGARLDIFWEEAGVKGHRRGVVVGTVATNSVPIDLGAGDNLPTNLTAVTACVPTEEILLADGDTVQCIGVKSSRRGVVVFADSSDVELHFVATELEGASGGGYQWYTGNGVTNPLAGDTIAKVFFSNGDSTYTNAMQAMVGVT